jgi:molybdate transport system substrate-binding protein
MTELHVLSAGAAKGLVVALAPALQTATGATLRAQFGAVGAIRNKWLAGAPCDVIIVTAAMQDVLAHEGRVVPASVALVGRVRTGIAVRAGEMRPDIADRDALRRSLDHATGLYVPDPERSTAGGHFLKVLRALGIHDTAIGRLRVFPNGAVAMQELAQSREPGLVGCTQVTEINYTPGVELAGPLPAEFELVTAYSAGVSATAREPGIARHFAQQLVGPESRELRIMGGFEL